MTIGFFKKCLRHFFVSLRRFKKIMNTILGFKQGATQQFTDQGKRIPVTRIKTGPCFVVQMKTLPTDGYMAVQLGLGEKRETRTNKPVLGHVKKAGLKKIPLFLREVRLKEAEAGELKLGVEVKAGDIFRAGDKVDVIGVSKGKGFTGVVKRWGFAGGPATHGQSDRERAPGSIGSTTTPGRVLKGKHMAGRSGGTRVTVKNLEVVGVDQEKEILVVKGLVPGSKKGLLIIRKKENEN